MKRFIKENYNNSPSGVQTRSGRIKKNLATNTAPMFSENDVVTQKSPK